VFLSKIWMFVVALAAGIALAIALIMPRPAQRAVVQGEHDRLSIACSVVDIQLEADAHVRVELAGAFSRAPDIVTALDQASSADKIDDARSLALRGKAVEILKGVNGNRKPDFAILVDRSGRIVTRVGIDESDARDLAVGRPLIDDALAGLLRDDIWAQGGTMYFVSASPVIKRDPPVAYVGAVVLGNKITNEFAAKLVDGLSVDLRFYLGADDVAGSRTLATDKAAMGGAVKGLSGGDLRKDCNANQPFDVRAGNEDMTAVVARLPGEARARQAYFAVLLTRPEARGFMGTLHAVTSDDLKPTNFPWFLVAGGFILCLGVGIALMLIEADRPLRRLTNDALKLAKGDQERLGEDAHGGKFGSIARSVNIHIDKLGRDAKAARTNLDQLLGPAPEGSLGTIDLLATALPAARPGGPATAAAAPPPSEFRFGDAPAATPPPRDPTPPPRAPTPAPVRSAPTPPPLQPPQSAAPPSAPPPRAPLRLEDDILGGIGGHAAAAPAPPAPTLLAPPADASGPVDPYFKQVFDQFVSVKKSCAEPTANLTYAKFSEKLIKNRDDLMARTGCKEVRFTVYVKDGKAALKATPVKDD